MSRLLPRWRRGEDAAEAQRAVDKAERESVAESEYAEAQGGDPERLRGIPVVGSGAGGEVTSSAPLRVCLKCGKPKRGKRRCRC